MAKKPKVELVNDWQKLEAAVADLGSHSSCYPEECGLCFDDVKEIVELVPRLIKAYEDLWENTMTMMKAWEAFVANQSPAGLYLPDTHAPGRPLTAPVTGK